MNQSSHVKYLVIAGVLLTPIALRVASWRTPRPQEVDHSMAQVGRALFEHEWKPNDPLANGGDGLGPVFNAKSCVACHMQNGTGGSGGVAQNVTTFALRPKAEN